MTVLASRDVVTVAKLPEEIASLKEPVLFVVGIDRKRMPPALLKAARTLWFEGAKDGVAVMTDADGKRFEAREAPVCPLAVVVDPSKAGPERHLLEWLQGRGSTHHPPVVQWTAGNEIEAAALLIRRISKALTSGAQRVVLANRELLTLRRLNDDLQNRFAAVEAFLGRRGLQPFDLAFANEPVGDPSRPNVLSDASDEGICQILPVASSGVSAVAIHFEHLPKRQEATVHAQLVTLEDHRIVDSWAIPSGDLVPGWNFLGLTRTLAGLRRTLELRLHVERSDDDLPLISLGGLQPVEMFQVRDVSNNVPLVKNSLALQVWCGLPGVVLPAWANYLPAASRQQAGAGGFKDVPIAPGILELATHANSDEVTFDFPAIMALPGERAISCHPPKSGMTIGQLAAACPPRAIRISADAFLANDQAKDVDFAIGIAGDLGSARTLFEGKRQPEVGEAFSGWTRVAYGDTSQISAFVAEQVGVWQNIYIATRMTKPGWNSFAWAKFRDIGVVVNG